MATPVPEITPALYGITRKIARPVIRDRWDNLVVPVLRSEDTLHAHTFRAFAVAADQRGNEALGWDLFREMVKHAGLPVEFVEIPRSVFETYWTLAEDRNYWRNGAQGTFKQQVPYKDALVHWRASNVTSIKWVEDNLGEWLN